MSIATALWLGATSPAAFAGQIVVHEGDPTQAIDEVVKRTGQPASDFTAVTMSEVLDGKVPLITAGKIERCTTGATPAADVEKHLGAAEEAIAAKDYEFALGPAKAAEKAALCADGPVTAANLARVAFAGGVAAHANGDPEAAKVAFRHAAVLEAKDWLAVTPDAMKDDMKVAVELSAKREITLSLVPSDGASIDGKPVPGQASLTVGPHWVDHAGTWMRVTLEPGTTPTLVVPAAVAPGTAQWASDPAKAPELARLLDAVAPGANYVVLGNDVYRRSATAGWEELPGPKKKFEAGLVVAPVGGVMAATGAVLAFSALGSGNQAVDTASTPGVTQSEFDAARADYDGAKTTLLIGDALIVGGVVLAGIGGGMLLDGASVGPWFLPGGAGVGVSVGGAR
jgi:hypothetical protein